MSIRLFALPKNLFDENPPNVALEVNKALWRVLRTGGYSESHSFVVWCKLVRGDRGLHIGCKSAHLLLGPAYLLYEAMHASNGCLALFGYNDVPVRILKSWLPSIFRKTYSKLDPSEFRLYRIEVGEVNVNHFQMYWLKHYGASCSPYVTVCHETQYLMIHLESLPTQSLVRLHSIRNHPWKAL